MALERVAAQGMALPQWLACLSGLECEPAPDCGSALVVSVGAAAGGPTIAATESSRPADGRCEWEGAVLECPTASPTLTLRLENEGSAEVLGTATLAVAALSGQGWTHWGVALRGAGASGCLMRLSIAVVGRAAGATSRTDAQSGLSLRALSAWSEPQTAEGLLRRLAALREAAMDSKAPADAEAPTQGEASRSRPADASSRGRPTPAREPAPQLVTPTLARLRPAATPGSHSSAAARRRQLLLGLAPGTPCTAGTGGAASQSADGTSSGEEEGGPGASRGGHGHTASGFAPGCGPDLAGGLSGSARPRIRRGASVRNICAGGTHSSGSDDQARDSDHGRGDVGDDGDGCDPRAGHRPRTDSRLSSSTRDAAASAGAAAASGGIRRNQLRPALLSPPPASPWASAVAMASAGRAEWLAGQRDPPPGAVAEGEGLVETRSGMPTQPADLRQAGVSGGMHGTVETSGEGPRGGPAVVWPPPVWPMPWPGGDAPMPSGTPSEAVSVRAIWEPVAMPRPPAKDVAGLPAWARRLMTGHS